MIQTVITGRRSACPSLARACPSLARACPVLALILIVAGCRGRDEISVYTIPKEKTAQSAANSGHGVFGSMPSDAIHNQVRSSSASSSAPTGTSAPAIDGRMLAAFVRRGDSTWFFKLSGPEEAVGEQVEAFNGLARSVRFGEGGPPEWTLPEGWKQKLANKNEMRFATLRTGSDAQSLEVSVMPLPHHQQTERQYALANVNRWRGQLDAAPIQSLDAKDSGVETVEVDGKTMYLVDLTGKLSGGGSGPPMARGPMPRGAAPPTSPHATTTNPHAPPNPHAPATNAHEPATNPHAPNVSPAESSKSAPAAEKQEDKHDNDNERAAKQADNKADDS